MNAQKIFLVLLLVFSSFALGFFSGTIAAGFGFLEQQTNAKQSIQQNILLASEKLEGMTFIAAVDSQGNGLLNKAQVEIIDGKGRVLFNTNPFVEPDTQFSLETAAKFAFDFTKKSMQGKDVIFSVSETPAQLIGGPSAGAAFTVATIAAIQGKKTRQDIALTGTINEFGKIGPVGGIIEKAQAGAQNGIKVFLVPKGQSTITFYKEVVREQKKGFFTIRQIELVPQQLDLSEYALETFGIKVQEIENIQEAVKLMIE